MAYIIITRTKLNTGCIKLQVCDASTPHTDSPNYDWWDKLQLKGLDKKKKKLQTVSNDVGWSIWFSAIRILAETLKFPTY